MRYFAFDIPFLATVDIELNGITKPRNGHFMDASRGPRCVELWLGAGGQFYILLELRPRRSSLAGDRTI